VIDGVCFQLNCILGHFAQSFLVFGSLQKELEAEAVPEDSRRIGIWVNNLYRLGSIWYYFRQALKPLGINVGEWHQLEVETNLSKFLCDHGVKPTKTISRLKEGLDCALHETIHLICF
jgi:hypothetical protein